MQRHFLAVAILASAGCQSVPIAERFDIGLADDEPAVRIDLEPVTLTEEVDNNIAFEIHLDPAFETEEPTYHVATVTQARVEYRVNGADCDPLAVDQPHPDDDCSPYLADTGLSVEITEGNTERVVVRGAVEAQLDWVQARYPGDEFDVDGRVVFGGELEGEAFLVQHQFTAIFADYR